MNGIYHVRIFDVSKHPEELIFDADRCIDYVSEAIDEVICSRPIEDIRVELHALNLWYWAQDKRYGKEAIDRIYRDNKEASMRRGYRMFY